MFQLAQLNVAVMKEPMESPGMANFVANLDRINALADTSPGFVWRLQTDEGNGTALHPSGENILVNLSVWQDPASLAEYVYKSAHREVMRRRKRWFERMSEAYLVLWWVPAGHRPALAEAVDRLEHLRRRGPSPTAFNFAESFPAPDVIDSNSLPAFCAKPPQE
jgi:hypothetical protein